MRCCQLDDERRRFCWWCACCGFDTCVMHEIPEYHRNVYRIYVVFASNGLDDYTFRGIFMEWTTRDAEFLIDNHK